MHIFIDESGVFAPVAPGRRSISAVGALVVPDHKIDLLFRRYASLREALPKNERGEVKGSKLNEEQVSQISGLLFRNMCIYEVVAIDLGRENVADIEAHRHEQARRITVHLTDEHLPSLVDEVWELRRTLESMQTQLFIQSTATFRLLLEVVEKIPAYFSLRCPKELAKFRWTVDAKEVGKLTDAERWWSKTMMPMLQSSSREVPMLVPEDGDFSYFDGKFLIPTPKYLLEQGFSDEKRVDLRRMMSESFRFSSELEPGLELVDILTNATRRALSGNLQQQGWANIPKLMIHRREQYINLISFSGPGSAAGTAPYADVVVSGFRRVGRPLYPRRGPA